MVGFPGGRYPSWIFPAALSFLHNLNLSILRMCVAWWNKCCQVKGACRHNTTHPSHSEHSFIPLISFELFWGPRTEGKHALFFYFIILMLLWFLSLYFFSKFLLAYVNHTSWVSLGHFLHECIVFCPLSPCRFLPPPTSMGYFLFLIIHHLTFTSFEGRLITQRVYHAHMTMGVGSLQGLTSEHHWRNCHPPITIICPLLPKDGWRLLWTAYTPSEWRETHECLTPLGWNVDVPSHVQTFCR